MQSRVRITRPERTVDRARGGPRIAANAGCRQHTATTARAAVNPRAMSEVDARGRTASANASGGSGVGASPMCGWSMTTGCSPTEADASACGPCGGATSSTGSVHWAATATTQNARASAITARTRVAGTATVYLTMPPTVAAQHRLVRRREDLTLSRYRLATAASRAVERGLSPVMALLRHSKQLCASSSNLHRTTTAARIVRRRLICESMCDDDERIVW